MLAVPLGFSVLPTSALASSPNSKPNLNATLTVAADLTLGKAAVFDPGAYNSNGALYMNFIYDQLAYETPQGLKPGLLQSWRFPNNQTAVFRLRPNLKFQDGTPLNADAVAYDYNRIINNHTMVKTAAIAGMASVTVLNKLTVQLNFSTPVAAVWRDRILFDNAGTGQGLVSPTAVQQEGANFSSNPVGAGPYKFVSYTNGVLTLARWKGYWHPAGQKFKTVQFIQAAAGAPTISALAGGAADLALPAPADVPSLRAQGITVRQFKPDATTVNNNFCESRPPFNNLQARQAVMYAVNRKELVSIGMQGQGVVSDKYLPANSPFYPANVKDPYSYNPSKARELLASAGLTGSKVGLLVTATDPTQIAVAQVLQAELNAVGFVTSIIPAANAFAVLGTVQWNIAFISWLGEEGVLPTTQSAFLLPGGVGNVCGFNDPNVSNTFNRVTQLVDLNAAQLKKGWAQWQRVEYQTLPEFEIANPLLNAAYTGKIKGISGPLVDGGTAAEMSQWENIYIAK